MHTRLPFAWILLLFLLLLVFFGKFVFLRSPQRQTNRRSEENTREKMSFRAKWEDLSPFFMWNEASARMECGPSDEKTERSWNSLIYHFFLSLSLCLCCASNVCSRRLLLLHIQFVSIFFASNPPHTHLPQRIDRSITHTKHTTSNKCLAFCHSHTNTNTQTHRPTCVRVMHKLQCTQLNK